MPDKRRILIVEDEDPIAQGLQDVLAFHGFQANRARDGREGLEMALTGQYDLILLDVMLPLMDGFEVCNRIRKENRTQPIIMLTAKTSEEDIIQGLTLGADDYVSKPFSVRELLLRIEAVLRRFTQDTAPTEEIQLGDFLRINTSSLSGEYLQEEDRKSREEPVFTRREVEILKFLAQNKSRPVSRNELLEHVWGYSSPSSMETRTVDIHMAKLRKKTEPNPKEPIYLITVRGEGYRLNN